MPSMYRVGVRLMNVQGALVEWYLQRKN